LHTAIIVVLDSLVNGLLDDVLHTPRTPVPARCDLVHDPWGVTVYNELLGVTDLFAVGGDLLEDYPVRGDLAVEVGHSQTLRRIEPFLKPLSQRAASLVLR
jgi:hypothetical protein